MAGVIGHTVVTATAGLVYKKHLNITTLFFGMAIPDAISVFNGKVPLIPGGAVDESFIGGLACAVVLTLLIMIGLKTIPRLMKLFTYKQSSSLKIIFISALIGTELHVLMDLIAINGWLNGTILS
ncbi:hypothetical protein ACLBXI_25525 [Bacillus cereus]